jgi:hypothetical protein
LALWEAYSLNPPPNKYTRKIRGRHNRGPKVSGASRLDDELSNKFTTFMKKKKMEHLIKFKCLAKIS